MNPKRERPRPEVLDYCGKCAVHNCHARAEHVVDNPMFHGPEMRLPVCELHRRHRLWWHKGWVFDRDEAG